MHPISRPEPRGASEQALPCLRPGIHGNLFQTIPMTTDPISKQILCIRDRWSGDTLFEAEAENLGSLLAQAREAGADLAFADLRNAQLVERRSRGHRSSPRRPAPLTLAGADLSRTRLSFADLRGADLRNANLQGTIFEEPDFRHARVEGARDFPPVPTVADLDAKILSCIENGGGLEMDRWHTCDTTHCRAGWAVVLAGYAGRILEERVGSYAAGALIYEASTGNVPDFFAENEDALEDIKLRAGRNAAEEIRDIFRP